MPVHLGNAGPLFSVGARGAIAGRIGLCPTGLGLGAAGGGRGGLGGDFEERRAVAAFDVLAAGGFGHHEDAAALEVGTHDADIFDRIHCLISKDLQQHTPSLSEAIGPKTTLV